VGRGARSVGRGVESGERAAGNGVGGEEHGAWGVGRGVESMVRGAWSVGRKTRGIGILANEETNLIGWKPMPLFPAPVEQAKSKGTFV